MPAYAPGPSTGHPAAALGPQRAQREAAEQAGGTVPPWRPLGVAPLGTREERQSGLMTQGEQNEDCEVTEEVGCYSWGLGLAAWQEERCRPGRSVLSAGRREPLGSAGHTWCPRGTDESGEATLPQGSPSPSYTGMKTVLCPYSGSLNTSHTMWKESRKTEWHILLTPFLPNHLLGRPLLCPAPAP